MKSIVLRAAAVAGLVGIVLGCAGLDMAGGGGAANKEACLRYVDHYNNGLPCLDASLDASMCDAVDQSPMSMVEYYDCLIEGATCNGDIPSVEVSDCTMTP